MSRRPQFAQRRKATGFTQERLAEHLRVDRSTVARWESGETTPSPWLRSKLADALKVSIEDLDELLTPRGLSKASLGERFSHNPGVVDLVTMDVDTDLDRWGWPGDGALTPVPERLGASDVDQIEQVTAGLRALDYRYGGGACRDAVIAQTRWVTRLLHADATNALRRRLHITLADLHNLAGWTSLDVGLYRSSRQHFAEAIAQARQAEEPSLLANVLYRTGRLHLHLGQTVQALRFFQLGQTAANDAADPLAVAVLCANKAWAHGTLGDADQANRSLHLAREEYAHADPATAAPWVRFFGPADLDATTGMVHLGLADVDSPAADLPAAREALTASLAARRNNMARSRAFELIALATACLRDHDPDEGISLTRQVVELVAELRSARVIDRLTPLINQLAVAPGADAADLTRQLTAAGTR